QETSRSSFNVELDAANATWLSNDGAMLSTKSGELLLLTLVHDGRCLPYVLVFLFQGITTVGSSFFFLGRLGDSLLVQFNCGAGTPMGAKEEVGDIEECDDVRTLITSVVKLGLGGRVLGEYSVFGPRPNRFSPTRPNQLGPAQTRSNSDLLGPTRAYSDQLGQKKLGQTWKKSVKLGPTRSTSDQLGQTRPARTYSADSELCRLRIQRACRLRNEPANRLPPKNHRAPSANCRFCEIGGVLQTSRSSFNVELDAANATWLSNDVAMLSTKSGELLLLTLVHDGRIVQKLDLSKSKASVLISGITTVGSSFFFLGSRLGDSLLVQFNCGAGSPMGAKEEVGDIEGDLPSAKRLRRSSSDALQDMVNDDELSLYGSDLNNAQSSQKTFSFTVRDSLINVGPLKDFSYGLRMNTDTNATGVAKQSNFELVCCSGHGKNGSVCVFQRSIRPEIITQEAIPGCKGLWTVYHKSSRNQADHSKTASEDDEYHAYLIISLENRTMVLQTVSNLEEVTENVDYFVQGRTIYVGNLFGRRRVIQVYPRGARILDGAFMTQDLSFRATNSEASMTVSSVSIADPYVLLMMTDGSIQLLVGDPSTCTMSINNLAAFQTSKKLITACTLYHDRGTEPWLRKTSTDAWLLSGVGEAIEGPDGTPDQVRGQYIPKGSKCVHCPNQMPRTISPTSLPPALSRTSQLNKSSNSSLDWCLQTRCNIP
ncbi:hypothetical protein R6Q57_021335, partial [Mikania cordata]